MLPPFIIDQIRRREEERRRREVERPRLEVPVDRYEPGKDGEGNDEKDEKRGVVILDL